MKSLTILPILLIGLTSFGTASVPTSPINAGAYNFTDTSARISFKDMSLNENGFRVEHVQNGNNVLTTLTSEDANTTGYRYINLLGLTPGTLYTVDIVAFNEDGDATPLRKSFRTLPTPQTPASPSNIGAYNFTNTSMRVSFLDNASIEDGFKIYNNGQVIATIPPHANTGEYVYTNLTGLNQCTLYTLDFVAYNANGESEKVEKSAMTTGCMTPEEIPLAPSNVGVYNITTNSARVSFMDNSNNEQVTNGFVIYNNDDNSTMTTLSRDRYDHEWQYANLNGLNPDTLYTIRVASKNGAGEGSTELKSFRTLPLPE